MKPDTAMTTQRRLSLYAAAEPGVIDAVELPKEGDLEWWSAPVSGSSRRLVWSSRGDAFLASRVDARIRKLAIGAIPFILIATLLTPQYPFVSIPCAVLVGVGVTHAVQRRWPRWTRFGASLDPVGAARAMEEFVGRYERDVAAVPPGEG